MKMRSPSSYGAIVVGAGHNGLTCACYLAKAGLTVLVLEQYRTVGGMSITEDETLPGFWSDLHPSGYQLANLSPVPRELDLLGRYELIEPELPFSHAFPDGGIVSVHPCGAPVRPRPLSEPSLDYLAQVYLECRGGLLPSAPMIVSWNDSAIDPSRAPSGKALMKLVVLNVPYTIKGVATGRVAGRTWAEAREPYADHLIDLITANYIPDLKPKILKRVVHSPVDIARRLTSAVHGTLGAIPGLASRWRRAQCGAGAMDACSRGENERSRPVSKAASQFLCYVAALR